MQRINNSISMITIPVYEKRENYATYIGKILKYWHQHMIKTIYKGYNIS